MAFKWVLLTNLRGPIGPAGEIGFQSTLPVGNVSGWYGAEKVGLYRAGNQEVTGSIPGRPIDAKPGYISIMPIGSTTSIVEWTEFGELGRRWRRTVSSTPAYASSWEIVQGVKRVPSSLTLGTATDIRTATNIGHALPLTIGAKAHRWRLHFRNTNDRFATTQSGALHFNEVAIGVMARDSTGKATGNYVPSSGTVILNDTDTSATGAEMVTDWVNHFPLEANTDYVIRYGFTAASGQQVNYLQGGGWELTGGSAVVHDPTTAQVEVKKSPLDVWIELEVDASTPNYAYFGDSLVVGQDSTLPVYDSWPARHARSRGAIPTFFAHSGAAFSEWTEPLGIKFRKYALPNYNDHTGKPTISRPDALYCAMGSNTIMGQRKTLSETIAEMNVTMPLIMEVTTTNVAYVTILPRHDPTDPQEPVRKAYNRHLEDNVPWGGLVVYDAAAAVTAANGNQLDKRWTATETNIHLTSGGYARVASQIGG